MGLSAGCACFSLHRGSAIGNSHHTTEHTSIGWQVHRRAAIHTAGRTVEPARPTAAPQAKPEGPDSDSSVHDDSAHYCKALTEPVAHRGCLESSRSLQDSSGGRAPVGDTSLERRCTRHGYRYISAA